MKSIVAGLFAYFFSTLAFGNVGTVAWFNDTKGFGQIEADNGKIVYYSFAELRGIGGGAFPKSGARVCFSVDNKDRRMQARNVKYLSNCSPQDIARP
jgi:CspA family cold shock protein